MRKKMTPKDIAMAIAMLLIAGYLGYAAYIKISSSGVEKDNFNSSGYELLVS